MPKLIVSEEKFRQYVQLESKAIRSKIIDPIEAQKMKDNFKESVKSHDFEASRLRPFRTLMEQAPDGGMRKGLAIQFGRPRQGAPMHIALEIVQYQREQPEGQVVYYRRLRSVGGFFGKLSGDSFGQTFRQAEIAQFDNGFSVKDNSGVLLALVGYNTLSEFLNNVGTFTRLQFDFARTPTDKLTAILSCWDNKSPVKSTVSGVQGIYFDDHDLIPPPNETT